MDNRSLRSDLLALGLLALVIFLTLGLLTYSPADPVGQLVAPLDQLFQPDVLVYPQHETVHNACGRWGALAASVLLTGLGVGAYYLVIALVILDVRLLTRREIDAPIVRLLGWCLSLVGLTSLASLLVPGLSPGPVIGSGGYLGALGAGLLEIHFALIGGVILAASLTVGGLLLCTDYTLVRVTHTVLRLALRSVTTGRGTSFAAHAADDASAALDEDEDEDEEEEEEEEYEEDEEDEESEDLAVRVRGKAVAAERRGGAEAEDDAQDDTEPVRRELVVRGRKKRLRADKAGRTAPVGDRRRKQRAEREEVMQSLDEASLCGDARDYQLPDIDLLIEADDVCFEAQAKEVRRKAKILEQTFANFGFNVKVVEIETGPVIAQYEVELEAGLRLSRITGLADDLAIALRVPSVRIVAPIPGKNTVGIEVPNQARQVVRLREVMEEAGAKTNKMRVPLFLGKDVSGNSLVVDLSTMPHLLIAGRTGTGKSVCLNAIISSMLMTRRPDEVRMLMIDPKMVELSCYGRLPHLMHPVVTDMRKAEAILAWAVEKMEERYSLLARSGVRHITSYNQLGKEELIDRLQPETDEERDSIPDQLPFIVIVADEMADLMMTAGKEVEQHIIRLAQKSRAVGIHLILATQKPTVDVITGLIKSNLPARIAFQVASRTDSRVVLDEMGAEKLLGNGDMLFLWPGTSSLLRGQGTYLTDDEINAIVDTVSTGEQNFVHELLHMKVKDPEDAVEPGPLRKRDDLYESAVDVVVREGRGSVSLLQRTLGIGYGRAARLIDFMAEDGIVGEYNGSQAREVLISIAEWEQMQGQEAAPNDEEEPAAKRPRANVIRMDAADTAANTAAASARPPQRAQSRHSLAATAPQPASATSKRRASASSRPRNGLPDTSPLADQDLAAPWADRIDDDPYDEQPDDQDSGDDRHEPADRYREPVEDDIEEQDFTDEDEAGGDEDPDGEHEAYDEDAYDDEYDDEYDAEDDAEDEYEDEDETGQLEQDEDEEDETAYEEDGDEDEYDDYDEEDDEYEAEDDEYEDAYDEDEDAYDEYADDDDEDEDDDEDAYEYDDEAAGTEDELDDEREDASGDEPDEGAHPRRRSRRRLGRRAK